MVGVVLGLFAPRVVTPASLTNTHTSLAPEGRLVHNSSLQSLPTGYGLSFATADKTYVRVADAPSLRLSKAFTIEAWIYQTAAQANGYRLVDKETAGTGDGYNFDTYDPNGSGRRLRLCVNSTEHRCVSANTVYSLNQPHHVAVVVAGSIATFYLDGQQDGSSYVGTVDTNTLDVYIGGPHPGCGESCGFIEYFNGMMSDVRLWDIALSTRDIQQSMHGHVDGTEHGLVGYWRFNEGHGTTAADSSGHGNTGTLVNGPSWLSSTNSNSTYDSTVLADHPSATWTSTGSMHIGRWAHTATLLPNGQVLVAGGCQLSCVLSASAELYNPHTGTWTTTGSMNIARAYHRATLLPNGTVLVEGGCSTQSCTSYTSSAEIYNPSTHTWTATGSMSTARVNQTATLLQNGEVLVAGGSSRAGSNAGNLASAEIYNPRTNTWTATGSMTTARIDHDAVLLPNGQALVFGGVDNHGVILDSAELYDPNRGTWTATRKMISNRIGSATVLSDGKVLVAGSCDSQTNNGSCANSLLSAEVYDPHTHAWTAAGSLPPGSGVGTPILLHNGQVLMAGGTNGNPSVANAELYDPATDTWNVTTSMNTPRSGHTATLLQDGRVLVAGGCSDSNCDTTPFISTELYSSSTNSPSPNPNSSNYDRTVLADHPVAYWPLDDTARPVPMESVAKDATGHGHDGQYIGGVQLASQNTDGGSGPFDLGHTAASFDGKSGYVNIPGTWGGASWKAVTVEAWVYAQDYSTQNANAFQAIVEPTDQSFVHFQLHPSCKVEDECGNVIYVDSGTRAVLLPVVSESSPPAWHYVVMTGRPGDSKIYVDGVERGSNNSTFSSITAATGLRIGSGYHGGRFFNGRIADVAIYDHALTAQQISTHYAITSNSPTPSPVQTPNPLPTPSPTPPSPPPSPCSTSTFTGFAVKVVPACGNVGDLVTVTSLHTRTRGANSDAACYISDQAGYGRPFLCQQGQSLRFRILPGGGYFEIVQPRYDGYTLQTNTEPRVLGFTALADAYCMAGSSFQMIRNPSSYDLDLKQSWDPSRYAVSVPSPCPTQVSPTPVPIPKVFKQSSTCVTPDIQVHPFSTTVVVHSLPQKFPSSNGYGISSPQKFPSSNGYGIVATFCDNDPTGTRSDYTADVIWNASYAVGNEVHPGASLYGPNYQSDIDSSPTIVENPAWPKKSKDKWAVSSRFLIQSIGHIRVNVIVHKKAIVHLDKAYAGAVSAAVSTVQIQWPHGTASKAAGANGTPSDVMRQAQRYNPWFTVGYFNHKYSEPYLIYPALPPDYNRSPPAFERAIVSALTSNQASSTFCDHLLDMLVHKDITSDTMQTPLRPYFTQLANAIAANASAADGLFSCASKDALATYANDPTLQDETWRLQLLWQIGATAFLDHLNDYADCNTASDASPQNDENYSKCNMDLPKEFAGISPDDARTKLRYIASFAAATLTHSKDSSDTTDALDPAQVGPLADSRFLEHGIALWVVAHLPHPIFCSQDTCANSDYKTSVTWTAGTAQILDALKVGIGANNEASGHVADTKTVLSNFVWGLGFWALGVAIPLAITGPVGVVTAGIVGLATTYTGAYVIPPIKPDYFAPVINEEWRAEFAGFLIESHSIYDLDQHTVMLQGYQKSCSGRNCQWQPASFNEQVASVLRDGIPKFCRDSRRYVLTDEHFKGVFGQRVCKEIFLPIYLEIGNL